MIDRERVLRKLTYLDGELALLRRAAAEPEAVARDPLRVGGLRYSIQTAIEAVIDVCFHVSAKVARHVPQGAHDALDAAVKGAGVPAAQVRRWHEMIGLRNILVHGYEEIEDARLLEGLPGGIADLEAFVALAQRWLQGTG